MFVPTDSPVNMRRLERLGKTGKDERGTDMSRTTSTAAASAPPLTPIQNLSPGNMSLPDPDLGKLFDRDPYLRMHEQEIRRRYGILKNTVQAIDENEGGLEKFTRSYRQYGIHVLPDNSIKCLEWAPGAEALFLRGDFNGWNQSSHPFKRQAHGKWELVMPAAADGTCAIPHESKVKLLVKSKDGQLLDRICPWATYVVQPQDSVVYDHVFWNPPQTVPVSAREAGSAV